MSAKPRRPGAIAVRAVAIPRTLPSAIGAKTCSTAGATAASAAAPTAETRSTALVVRAVSPANSAPSLRAACSARRGRLAVARG